MKCCFLQIFRKASLVKKRLFLVLGSIILITIYMLIEPYFLTVEYDSIPLGINKKIVLISDLHLGIFGKRKSFLERIVKTINQIPADAVLIAGDFTYYPKTEELDDLFSPLADLNKATYAILGNHDVGYPGPHFKKELTQALIQAKVHILENQIVSLDGFYLIGLGEYWEGITDISLLQKSPDLSKTIVLLHNPDILSTYDQKYIPSLTLAGHTHGGQIRIPWLYKYAIPTQGDFDRGYGEYELGDKIARFFISSGLWETGLPMRFLCPPTIYVIDLK